MRIGSRGGATRELLKQGLHGLQSRMLLISNFGRSNRMATASTPQQGNETRSSILPSTTPSGLGFFGSPYSPGNAMLSPPQIGVTTGDSMSDVLNAVSGVAFYTDTIGFGAPSSGLDSGMPLKPLGVNYFMSTGATCSNGATMYNYFQGIPQGNALGSRIEQVMQQMNLPPLKGLAPGMIEDAENALNPGPLLNTLFGSGYPQCKQATLMVGDAYGHIQDPSDGTPWIDQPQTATLGSDGLYYQTRWIQDTDASGNPIYLTEAQWNATPRTYNSDGTPIAGSSTTTQESFVGNIMKRPASIAVISILCLLAFGALRRN
jgi:hypothetical protein